METIENKNYEISDALPWIFAIALISILIVWITFWPNFIVVLFKIVLGFILAISLGGFYNSIKKVHKWGN